MNQYHYLTDRLQLKYLRNRALEQKNYLLQTEIVQNNIGDVRFIFTWNNDLIAIVCLNNKPHIFQRSIYQSINTIALYKMQTNMYELNMSLLLKIWE